MEENPDKTPQYQPPGLTYVDSKDAKGMVRMINKMLGPKLRLPRKGLQSNQNVKIGHKHKVKYY